MNNEVPIAFFIFLIGSFVMSKASERLMIGALGVGVFPLLMGMMADEMGENWRWTRLVVLVGEIVILYYGLKGYKIKISDVDAH